MTGRERCDEILRIIDQVLGDADAPEGTPGGVRPRPPLAAGCGGGGGHDR